MSQSNFDLNFEQTQYYTLQEASTYLNKKHGTNSVTPQKLIKHIVSYDTPAYIHVRFSDEHFKVNGDFKSSILETPEFIEFMNKPYNEQDENDGKYWLSVFEGVEKTLNTRLFSYFHLGLILLKVDNSALFNMSFGSKGRYYPLIGFDGVLLNNALEANPKTLDFIKHSEDKHYITEVDFFTIFIDGIDEVDIEEIKNSISLDFDTVYRTNGDRGFPEFKIQLEDLVITDKDLQALEDQIIKNAPTVKREPPAIDRHGLPSKKGVSPKLLQARLVADAHAQYLWSKDHDKKIRVGEMYEHIWNYLVDTDYRDMLPENKESLRKWLSYIPDYASQPGKAPTNK